MANPAIESLLQLQKLDLRLRDLEMRLKTLPKEMEQILQKRDAVKSSTMAAVNKVKAIRARIEKEQTVVAALNADSEKLRQQTASVRKNNEYQAMLAAIELNKKKVGDAEERILIAMDELEAAKKEGRKLKVANDAEIANLKVEFDELYSFSKVVQEEAAKLKAERPRRVALIPPALLSPYQSLLNGKNGYTPLIAVEGEICGNCCLKITQQTLIKLQHGEIAFCDNCQSMLYKKDAE